MDFDISMHFEQDFNPKKALAIVGYVIFWQTEAACNAKAPSSQWFIILINSQCKHGAKNAT